MSIQTQIDASVAGLLKAAEQLSDSQLDRFVSELLALRAKRRVPDLPQRETELLQQFYQGIPTDIHKRYEALTAKRRAESIQPGDEEYDELLRLTHQVEKLDAQRLGYLVELANLRGVTLDVLMDDLGIEKFADG